VNVISIFRVATRCFLLGFAALSLLAAPAFPVEYQDSQIFITGFNAYQNKNYQGAISNMSQILEKYPNSPLRDMSIFWLARSNFKAGHRKEAAKYMAQFYKEYPNSPLKNTVEPELAKLAAAYAKGETISEEPQPAEEPVVAASAPETKQTAEKAEAERLAAETAIAEKADAERLAAKEKAAADAAMKEKTAVEKPVERVATAKGSPEKASKKKAVSSARTAKNAAMRAKAIAGYKSIIRKYPGTRAARVAAAKLMEMGVAVPYRVGARALPSGANAQIMTLEIEQFADCTLNSLPLDTGYPAGKRFSIPIELVNQGNGPDSFALESLSPERFNTRFVSSANPDNPITVTPKLVPGETFRGMLTGVIPSGVIDGEQVAFPIKAVSQFSPEVSQSRQVSFIVSAPLLRAVINPDKTKVLPDESVVYHIALLNAGTADASRVSLNLDYSPHYEPVDSASVGFRQGANGVLTKEGLTVRSGESKDFTVILRVKEGAPANTQLLMKANVINAELENRESFFSVATVVQEISGVAARSNTDRLIVIPGQTMTVPLVVTNTGNIRESFRIASDAVNGVTCRYYQDFQRNGRRAPDAQPVTMVGPLEPLEEAYLIMEMTTPSSIADGAQILVGTSVESDRHKGRTGSVSLSLWFSRPIVELASLGREGKLKPAEISSYEFTVVNRGSNIAKAVEIQSILPENLEILAADVPFVQGRKGEYFWSFLELGAGEKRVVKVSFRVKTGIPMGTNLQIKNIVSYEDQLGNRY
jgi:hypothetical protein